MTDQHQPPSEPIRTTGSDGRLVIAIDGPSGSGKSSTARGVADRLGLAFLDTGAMYRAITWLALEEGVDLDNQAAVAELLGHASMEIDQDPRCPAIAINGIDVTDARSLDGAAGRVRRELGGIDLVVYCAGFWKQMDATSWDREVFAQHVEVNLLGLNNLLGAVLPQMVGRGRGQVVGVASVAGYRGFAGAEAYGATKAAQINQMEALRTALRPHGVTVTTVCPGFVRTELTAGAGSTSTAIRSTS